MILTKNWNKYPKKKYILCISVCIFFHFRIRIRNKHSWIGKSKAAEKKIRSEITEKCLVCMKINFWNHGYVY